jgi:hypothetical protein
MARGGAGEDDRHQKQPRDRTPPEPSCKTRNVAVAIAGADGVATTPVAAGARPGAVSRGWPGRARRVRSGHRSARRLMALAIA